MAFLAPILGALAGPLINKIFKFEEGGMVPGKKGSAKLALVHGGERVLTPSQNKEYTKMMRKGKKSVPKSKAQKGSSNKSKTKKQLAQALKQFVK